MDIKTDNPEVAKLLIAKYAADTFGLDSGIDKYLRVFDKAFKAIRESTKAKADKATRSPIR